MRASTLLCDFVIVIKFGQFLQLQVYESTEHLSNVPSSILSGPSSGKSWHYDGNTYADLTKCNIKPGHANISICWYNQGWGVCDMLVLTTSYKCADASLVFLA